MSIYVRPSEIGFISWLLSMEGGQDLYLQTWRARISRRQHHLEWLRISSLVLNCHALSHQLLLFLMRLVLLLGPENIPVRRISLLFSVGYHPSRYHSCESGMTSSCAVINLIWRHCIFAVTRITRADPRLSFHAPSAVFFSFERSIEGLLQHRHGNRLQSSTKFTVKAPYNLFTNPTLHARGYACVCFKHW